MTFRLKYSLLLILIGMMAVFVAGCGGGSRSPGAEFFGSASLTVLWPARSVQGASAESVRIAVLDADHIVAQRTVNRPDQGDASITSFDQIPIGLYRVTVTAYPQINGAGTPETEASSQLTIQTSQDTKLSFSAAGIVDRIEVTSSGSSLAVGGVMQLTATPMTADGVVVLVPANSITWQSQNSGIATVEPDGTVRGIGVGETDITATESSSGQSGSLRMTITGSRWTVMVYMAADNNLETYAIQDLNEMETIGSGGGISVVAQVDRSASYDTTNGNWSGTRRYYITKDSDTSTVASQQVADLGQQNMASPDTLANFVQWAASTYPADHYLLVLWDHGRGWRTRAFSSLSVQREIRAVCIDDSANDEMSLAELTQALHAAHRTDIVLFDACLMGMIEVAYSVKDSADIMIASEENVPIQGQSYGRLLGHIASDPYLSPDTFSHAIVDDYISYYSNGYDGSFTFSAIDLHAVDRLSTAADQLATAVISNIGEVRTGVADAQAGAQQFDTDKGEYRYYRDLYDFARRVNDNVDNPSVRSAAQGVMAATNDTVLYEGHLNSAVDNSHGISVFLPDPGNHSLNEQYGTIGFSLATHWDEMVGSY